MKKIVLTIAILCLAIVSVFAFGSKEKEAATEMPKTAVMGSGGMGGTSHATFSMIATQIQKYTDVTVTNQASGGSSENARLIKQGEYEFGMMNTAMIVYALNGTADFKADGPYKDIRFVANLYPSAAQAVVRKSSNIQSFADLKGKVFSPGPAGSGDVTGFEEIVGFYGLTTKDMDWRPLTNTERVSAFKDRILDCGGWLTSFPAGNILELSTATPIRLLSIADKDDEFFKKFPYYVKMVIPKETYNGMDADVIVPGVGIIVASRADVNAELVYTFLKGMYMGLDELQTVHSMATYIKLETALDGSKGVPIHDGAIKYFKEKGVLK